jgi:hypothetical protein
MPDPSDNPVDKGNKEASRNADPFINSPYQIKIHKLFYNLSTILYPLVKENTSYIIIEHKKHKQDQNKEANLLSHFTHLQVNRPAAYGLDETKEKVSPVQDRDRQQVDDA